MRFFKPWLFSLKSMGFCWDVSIRALAMAIPANNTQQSKPRVREEQCREDSKAKMLNLHVKAKLFKKRTMVTKLSLLKEQLSAR